MHFGFGLDSSDVDLWNINLLDTHSDLLGTDIPRQTFCLSERRLEAAFKTCL